MGHRPSPLQPKRPPRRGFEAGGGSVAISAAALPPPWLSLGSCCVFKRSTESLFSGSRGPQNGNFSPAPQPPRPQGGTRCAPPARSARRGRGEFGNKFFFFAEAGVGRARGGCSSWRGIGQLRGACPWPDFHAQVRGRKPIPRTSLWSKPDSTHKSVVERSFYTQVRGRNALKELSPYAFM